MRIRLLGSLGISSSTDEPVRLATRKAALLVAALVLEGQKGVRRQALCDAFWSDRGEAQARGSLRQALALIRRALVEDGDPSIQVDGDLETVQLIARAEDVDVWKFDQLLHKTDAAALVHAADLYRGDVMAGIAVPEPASGWFASHQHAYRRKALLLVERLSCLSNSHGDTVELACQALAERLLATDSAAEEAHRALIRLHQQAGRVNAARRQFELCKGALRHELDAEPEAQTVALMAAPLQAGAPADSPQTVRPLPGTAPAATLSPRRDRDQPSIIIMPFDNLSGPADEYFVDGVVEEITATLSRVREFFVIARQSAFTYKGRFVDVREVGRELDVSYVVEGTVRRGGDRLRISVQLVSAETRAQLWSDRYEGSSTDIFEFQDKIAAQVAGAIYPAVRKAEIESARRKPPGSLRAYDLVLQAYPMIWSQNPQENAQAVVILQQAIAADPRYGRAHALLAWCHSQDFVYLWSRDPEHSRQSARMAVDAASGLIGDDPTALAAVGAAISQCLDDLPRANSYIESALSLDPNNAWAWARYAWLAIYENHPDRARERFERSLALSPLDPLEFNLRIGLAMTFGQKGDYVHAAALIREVLNKHPQVTWAYRQLAFVLAMAGDLPGAREAIEMLRTAHPNVSIASMRMCHPMRHLPEIFDPMIASWRLAGLPEE